MQHFESGRRVRPLGETVGGAVGTRLEAAPRSSTLTHTLYPPLAVALLFLPFLPILPGDDALTTSFGGRGAFEILTLTLGGVLSFLYAYVYRLFPVISRDKVFLSMLALSGWAVLSCIWAINPPLAAAKGLELLSISLTAGVLRSVLSTEHKHRLLVTTLLAFIGFLIVYDVLIWHTPFPFTLTADAPGANLEPTRNRLFLGFAHPLVTADFIALAALMTLFKPGWSRLFQLPAVLLLIGMLWFTNGRFPQVAFVVSLLVTAFFCLKRPISRALWLVGLAFVGLGYSIYIDGDWGGQFNSLINQDVLTLNGRSLLWSYITGHLAPMYLLSGVGYYSTRNVLIPYLFWAGHAHNSYLELLLGLGVPALFPAAILLYQWWRRTFSGGSWARRQGYSWQPLLCAVGVYTILQGFMNPLLFIPGVPMVALLLAFPALAEPTGRQPAEDRPLS